MNPEISRGLFELWTIKCIGTSRKLNIIVTIYDSLFTAPSIRISFVGKISLNVECFWRKHFLYKHLFPTINKLKLLLHPYYPNALLVIDRKNRKYEIFNTECNEIPNEIWQCACLNISKYCSLYDHYPLSLEVEKFNFNPVFSVKTFHSRFSLRANWTELRRTSYHQNENVIEFGEWIISAPNWKPYIETPAFTAWDRKRTKQKLSCIINSIKYKQCDTIRAVDEQKRYQLFL